MPSFFASGVPEYPLMRAWRGAVRIASAAAVPRASGAPRKFRVVLIGRCSSSRTSEISWGALQVADQRIGEGAGRHFLCTVHETGEIVSDDLLPDRAVHGGDDRIRRLHPAKVTEHHLAREDHGAGIDLVEIGVFRRGAVGRLEHRMPGEVIDVAAGGNADAADLRGE